MIPNDNSRNTGSWDQLNVSGWTSLHSWIFLAIVILAVLVMGFQNRYHYLSPLGLGKAYRIDKLFGGIQEYDPSKGWIVAQLQPIQQPMSMSGPPPESSQAVPMHMQGMPSAPPGTVGTGAAQAPESTEEEAAPPEITREVQPKTAVRGKESPEMSLDERVKQFQKAFPGFGKEEFQLANDDLYPDWKKNAAPNGTWPEFLGVYREFVQWWTDQGSPPEAGAKLWKDFLTSRQKR
jgi:hypothetical protein